MRYIISDLLGSLDISRQMSASFNLLMTIIIIFTHSRWRKTGRTNVKSQRGCEREMFKGFFLRLFSPFHLILPLVGFWSNVACFGWKKRFHGYPKIQTPKRCNSSGSGHKKIRVDSLMSNMYVADKATV